MTNRRYCKWLKDSTLWAVEFDGPKCLRAAGPLRPPGLASDLYERELPIDLAAEASPPLTLRLLVKLCESEINRIILGIERRGVRTE